MQRKRFTAEQIIRILHDAEVAGNVRDVCRQHNIAEQTLYRWRRQFGGMEVSDRSPDVPAIIMIPIEAGHVMHVVHPVCCGIAGHPAPRSACLRRVREDGTSHRVSGGRCGAWRVVGVGRKRPGQWRRRSW